MKFVTKFLLNGQSSRTLALGQLQYTVIVEGRNEEDARQKIGRLRLPGTFELEPVDVVEMNDLPERIRRHCQKSDFELIITREPTRPPRPAP